jgi:hypothetical protein
MPCDAHATASLSSPDNRASQALAARSTATSAGCGSRRSPTPTSIRRPASAIAAADLDNDGDRDLVLAGPGVARVLANRGDGTFTEAARIDGLGLSEHVLPVDLDGDGLLELHF